MENRGTYNVGLPTSVDAFSSKACCLLFSDSNYQPPEPEEVDLLIRLAGWSQRQVAEITGVSYNAKGSTTVRKWRTERGNSEHRQIPYAAWRLLLLASGTVKDIF